MRNKPLLLFFKTYLALCFGSWSDRSSASVLQLQLLDKCVALWWRKIWLLLLSEVELYSAVLHQDVWEERTTSQLLTRDAVARPEPLAVFGERHLHLLSTLKILQEGTRVHSEGRTCFTVTHDSISE